MDDPSTAPHSRVVTVRRDGRRHPIRATKAAARHSLAWLARRIAVTAHAVARLVARVVRRRRDDRESVGAEMVVGGSRWRTRLSPSARRERKLGLECEAFVAGRYHHHLPRKTRWEWAWVNTLAHGTRSEIEALADTPDKRGQAAAYAATEVLATGDRYGMELTWLQADFLVPVEVECMQRRSLSAAATTGHVLAALRRARFAAGSAQSDRPG